MSNSETLKNLNTALQMELSAQHQYQLHSHVLDDWGIDRLAAKMREEFAEEAGHSDVFLARIMTLGGTPDMAFASKPKAPESLKAMFEADLSDELEAIRFYTQAAKAAYAADDLGSYELFKATAIDEEAHRDWLQLQLDLMERIGEERYTFKHISGAGAEG